MGWVSKIVGGSVTEPIEAVGNVITSIFGDKTEKLSHQEVMARLAQAPAIAQTEINRVEASHRSIFVAGWRPFIGWVAGLGLANAFLINPTLSYFGMTGPELPLSIMTELVYALLGLGALRTVEKLNGRTK